MNTRNFLVFALASCILLPVVSAVRADVVTEWNEIMVQTAQVETPDPVVRARTATIAQVAVFEAVNSIVGDYEPYDHALVAPQGASAEAAAIAAAHRVLSTLHPQATSQLDAARDQSLATIPDGTAKTAGIAVGIAAADSIIALRADDGVDAPVSYMAIWDSAIACLETKYHFNLWRPVTAIREAQTDGNRRTEPDTNWAPAVFTPPFPSYPSAHASLGGAARAVLEQEFGRAGHVITLTHPALTDIVLQYTTFKQITDDIDDARIYGGIHYRFDQQAGARQGKRVGEYVLRHALRSACAHRDRRRGTTAQ